MRRLAWLGLGTVAVALGLGLLLQREPAPETATETASPPPVARTDVELTARGTVPYRVRVPKDHEVHLTVRGAPDAAEGLLAISGYEDRVRPVDIGPGLAREIVFVSNRPGDDFAITLGGVVLGRLEVTGSHLQEGHQ